MCYNNFIVYSVKIFTAIFDAVKIFNCAQAWNEEIV